MILLIQGHSFGGATAFVTALREPKRISGVCLPLDAWLYPIKKNELTKPIT